MSASLPAPVLDAEHNAALETLTQSLDPIGLSWVSGYLAGLSRARAGGNPALAAHALQAESRPDASVRATILYASQTGNSRRVAERLARSAEASGLAVHLVSTADYAPRELANERLLFFATSTQGDGDPPDDARALFEFVLGKRAPRLERLAFAVLALGDSSYPKYCETGRQIDARLAALGAHRLAPLQECDLDYETPAAAWAERALDLAREQLAEIGGPRLAVVTPLRPTAASAAASRERPIEIEVLANQRITGRGSDKDVRHLELAAPAGRLDYEPGDALCIVHRNPAMAIDGVLRAAQLDGAASVEHDGRSQPLAAWLEADREITRLSRPFLEAHARLANASELAAALTPAGATQLRELLADWQVADVLKRWPAAWTPAALVAALRLLAPRLYSIASSRVAVGDEVHLTVATIDYRFGGERRVGSASQYLAALAAEGATLPAYVEHNPRFRLPADGARDVIMIGPGTGVAPFRGFVQQREAAGARGRNWLFFGARHFDDGFLYQAEWLTALKRGTLHRMDVAFSRDQPQRIYVQQRIAEQGAELWRWLDGGAHVYVCGDAQKMAPDVHAALIEVVRRHGGRDTEAARAYLDQLLAERRYARDVY
ncbi:MAG: assimilatory sulfite reductase (NADPH) flavoprotein subunit [Sinobacteraceae bacterium]|nr:assimilatory sulfite reductase (NADPH) flavoprotein subunit [Nevskiaceae bacterium]MCP5466242.1 assimilatory sulfite reductase (NADPH) flavoprotein subunit [Nevskiaceae bacterium]MCP5471644.1 assimilatory sulfite reductase (NADPH) flavoprotein subunit [Nevskiaceae bacterium]